MKKYIASILAVVIAFSLSAFTSNRSASSTADRSGTPLFWYEYDPVSDELGALINPNPSQKVTKEFVLEEALTDCDDTHMSIECLRGYNDIQSSTQNPGPGIENIKDRDQ